MLRKRDRLTWIVVTMSLLLALDCICGEEETTTRRLRHQSNRGGGSSASGELDLITSQLEREFRNNVNLIHNTKWQCGVPKPRLVYFNEATEAAPQIPPHSRWDVQATVMHRCEAAFGCCTPPKQCRPVHTDTIRIVFRSVHQGTGDPTYHRIPFDNHTSCACMDT